MSLVDLVREMYERSPYAERVSELCEVLARGSKGAIRAEYEDVRTACNELVAQGYLEEVSPEVYRMNAVLLKKQGHDPDTISV